jgi:hypothetical protein
VAVNHFAEKHLTDFYTATDPVIWSNDNGSIQALLDTAIAIVEGDTRADWLTNIFCFCVNKMSFGQIFFDEKRRIELDVEWLMRCCACVLASFKAPVSVTFKTHYK